MESKKAEYRSGYKSFNSNISVYQSKILQELTGQKHFFSTRTGGVSTGKFASLNFGTQYGEDEKFPENLKLLADALDMEQTCFVVPKQTHSSNIEVVTRDNYMQTFSDCDALISNVPGMCLAVKTADCTPILAYDPMNRAIAAIHAGWRGSAENIAAKTIALMQKEFGSETKDLRIAIGPCIGQKNYEVGAEVVSVFTHLLPNPALVLDFTGMENGKARLNVAETNRQQLLQIGIPEENIDLLGICTFDNPSDFYSARRDGSATGRMLNGIMLI